MGYESRLYVVQKPDIDAFHVEETGRDMYWGEVIATFNMCCIPDVAEKMNRYRDTDICILAEGGTWLVRDGYGRYLKEVPLMDAIQIIKEASETDAYRRYKPCLAFLEALDEKQWGELYVLHYGY